MNNHRVPSNSTPNSARAPKLLKFAEYASLAASVVGTIASATSQQIIYAAAPITVSLALNLANRQRFEQRTQQRITAAINQVDGSIQQLEQRIAQLQEQLTTALDQHAAGLEETAARQNEQTAAALAEFTVKLTGLSQQFEQEFQAIRRQLQAQPEPINPARIQGIEQSLEQLRRQIAELEETARLRLPEPNPAALEVVRQSMDLLVARIASLEAEVRQLSVPTDSAESGTTASRQPTPPPIPEDEGLEELCLNLGIDFGTSFTKVCFRDLGRDRSEVVTFSNPSAKLEEALMPTQIGILPDGRLIAGLTAAEWQTYEPGLQTKIEFIKMRLASLDLPQAEIWRLENLPELDQPEMVENLCAYYLSRVINRAQTWIRQNRTELIVNQRIVWSANVGVPVAYCDSPALDRFKKVLSLAWLLSNEPQTEWLTLESLTKQMVELRLRLTPDDSDCFAVPEIAAEAWSFFNSREADDGFYTFFDIGDGSIDAAAFYYFREEGEPRVDFYAAQVEPLGVAVFSQLLAKELGQSAFSLKRMLCRGSLQSQAVTSSRARRQIQKLVGSVICQGKAGHFRQFPNGRRPGTTRSDFQSHLPIFVGGGGGTTAFYQETITATHTNFNHSSAGIPPYQIRALPFPKDLAAYSFQKQDFHRFAVAYGLSLVGVETTVRLPSAVAADQPRRGQIRQPSARPKHADMKDLC